MAGQLKDNNSCVYFGTGLGGRKRLRSKVTCKVGVFCVYGALDP